MHFTKSPREEVGAKIFIRMMGIENVCHRFNWLVHAYCQMNNHYHLRVETLDCNLSRGMRQLNGHYTQCINRTHGLSGHPLQGRYKAILVQKEAYLLAVIAGRWLVCRSIPAKDQAGDSAGSFQGS